MQLVSRLLAAGLSASKAKTGVAAGFPAPNAPDKGAACTAREIGLTSSRFPPMPPHDELVAGPVCSELVFEVDVYGMGSRFARPIDPVNNLALFNNVLFKLCDNRFTYSTRNPMPGFIETHVHVSLVPKPRSAQPSEFTTKLHRFHIHFDTPANAEAAIPFLSRFVIEARFPHSAIVSGCVLVFRFNESTQQISNTLGEHAWYENCASSLHVDRSTRTDPKRAGFDADDVTNYNDKCWFRVSESELKHVFSIPASDSCMV